MVIVIKKNDTNSNFKAVQAFSGQYSIWSMKHLSVRTGSFSNTSQILAASVKYSSCLCLLLVENYQKLLIWSVSLT